MMMCRRYHSRRERASVGESAGTADSDGAVERLPGDGTDHTGGSTTNGTAMSGTDYTALTQNVVFAAATATLTQTVSITVTDDGLDELDETFTVGFGTLPPGVAAGTPATVTVTLTDDDVPTVSFTSGTAGVAESAGTATVTVQLSASPSTELTIPVSDDERHGDVRHGLHGTDTERSIRRRHQRRRPDADDKHYRHR